MQHHFFSFKHIETNVLLSFIISIMALCNLSSCHYEDEAEYDKFWDMIYTGVMSEDGTLTISADPIFPEYASIQYKTQCFSGRENIFGAAYKDGKPYIEIGGCVVQLVKLHSDTEMTVKISGKLKIKSVRVHTIRDDGNGTATLTAYRGYDKSIVPFMTPVDAVTADGASQIAILLDDSAYNITSVDIDVDCRGASIVDDSEIGSFSEPTYVDLIDRWIVIYTAPKKFSSHVENGESFYDLDVTMSIKMDDGIGGILEKEYEIPTIRVYPQAVLLVHGLISSAEDCWGDFRNYLVDVRRYPLMFVVMADYEDSHAVAFEFNTFYSKVLPGYVDELYADLLSCGIVSSNYAFVGHSMGGILSRLYGQKINSDAIGKIITLDTPHWGSQLADLASNQIIPYVEFLRDTPKLSPHAATIGRVADNICQMYHSDSFAAFRDLSTHSYAIMQLNDGSVKHIKGKAVHAICSIMDDPEVPDKPEMPESLRTVIRIGFKGNLIEHFIPVSEFYIKSTESMAYGDMLLMYGATMASKKVLDNLYGEPCHDGIVSFTSQRGGLSDRYITEEHAEYKGPLGFWSDAHHVGTNKWMETYSNISRLLSLSPDDECFSHEGFGSSLLANTYSSAVKRSEEFGDVVISKTAWIKLKDVVRGPSDIDFEIEQSNDVISTLILVDCGEYGSGYASQCCKCTVQLPDGADAEDAVIMVIGVTKAGEYVSTSSAL